MKKLIDFLQDWWGLIAVPSILLPVSYVLFYTDVSYTEGFLLWFLGSYLSLYLWLLWSYPIP